MGRRAAIIITVIGLLSGAALFADGVTRGPVHQLVSGLTAGVFGARSDLAVAPDGRVLVAWSSQNASTFEIWYAVLDPNGNFLTPPTQLSLSWPAGLMGAPRTVKVASTNNNFMIMWDAQNTAAPLGTDYDIWFHVLDHNGVLQLASPVMASTAPFGTEKDPDCTGLLSGAFYLTWVRHGSTPSSAGEGIYLRRFDETGTPLDPAEIRVDDPAGNLGFQQSPSVAVWPGGNCVVVWQDGLAGTSNAAFTPDGSGTAVLGRWLDWNLAPLSTSNVLINSVAIGDQQVPHVSSDYENCGVVAWSGPGTDGALDIWYRRFDGTGVAIDPLEVNIPSPSAPDQRLDAASMTPSGEFALAWYEEPAWSTCGAATSNPARVARFTYDATLIEIFECAEIATGANSQARAGMALDQYGNVMCAYESCIPGSGLVDLDYRRFSRNMIRFSNTSPPIGTTVGFTLDSPSDPNHIHLVLASFGTGPLMLGERRMALSPDLLFGFSLLPTGYGVFNSFLWVFDATGISTVPTVNIPNSPVFRGITFYFAFLAGLTSTVTISDTYSFTPI